MLARGSTQPHQFPQTFWALLDLLGHRPSWKWESSPDSWQSYLLPGSPHKTGSLMSYTVNGSMWHTCLWYIFHDPKEYNQTLFLEVVDVGAPVFHLEEGNFTFCTALSFQKFQWGFMSLDFHGVNLPPSGLYMSYKASLVLSASVERLLIRFNQDDVISAVDQ